MVEDSDRFSKQPIYRIEMHIGDDQWKEVVRAASPQDAYGGMIEFIRQMREQKELPRVIGQYNENGDVLI